jgi:hypothetical protein
MRCGSPKELLSGDHPETELLRAAKIEVAAALTRQADGPRIRATWRLIRSIRPARSIP